MQEKLLSNKDFNKWNELKKVLHLDNARRFFHTREIWWCSLGLNIGFEQDGKNDNFERPVLILKKFNDSIVLILPLTKNQRNGIYYCNLKHRGNGYSIILSQIRLISSKRLLRRIRTLSVAEYEVVKKLFKSLI